METLVASVVILETSSSYPREDHPILMMMMVCSFRFIRRAALLALLGKKVVERQSSRISICKKRTFRINNTLNIWTKKKDLFGSISSALVKTDAINILRAFVSSLSSLAELFVAFGDRE